MPYLPEKRKISRKRVRIFMPRPHIQQPGSSHAWGWVLIVIFFVVVLAYLGWKVYRLGDTQLVEENRSVTLKIREFEARIDLLSGERDELRQQVASLERSAQIDQEAAKQLREDLTRLQSERLELKEELTLVETLRSGKTPDTRLRVSKFKVTKLASKRRFRYSMTTTLAPEQKKSVTASVNIRVSGTQNDAPKDLNLLLLGKKKKESRTIKFKHLYMFEEEVLLPEGFDPEQVTVDITTNNKNVKNLTSSFPWEAF